MRRSYLLPLAAVATFLSACGDSTGPKGLKIFDCANGNRYQIGQTVSGSVAGGDCTDPNGEGRADYYQFTLSSAGPVAIKLENTSNASPRLINAILDQQGNLTHFRLTSLAGSSTVGGNLPAGTYVLVVAASEENQTSNYRLTSSATLPALFDCTAIGAITIGTPINGTFSSTDCTDPFGFAPTDYYRFTLAAPAAITLRLTVAAGTGTVGLTDSNGDLVDAVASSPGVPAVLTVNLPAGQYYALAAADEETQTGAYTLESSTSLAASAQRSSPLPVRRLAPWSAHRRW